MRNSNFLAGSIAALLVTAASSVSAQQPIVQTANAPLTSEAARAALPEIEIVDGVVLDPDTRQPVPIADPEQPLDDNGLPPGVELVEGDIQVSIAAEGGAYGRNICSGGVVPYEFDSNTTPAMQTQALSAMQLWEQAATIDFVPRNGEYYHIHIRDSSQDTNPGNNSPFGRQWYGGSTINIVSWTDTFGLYVNAHELGHTLGYYHEQSRYDRGQYVQINTGNIQDGFASQFDFRPGNDHEYGPYDFDSVMHYSQCAFSTCCNGTSCPGCGTAQCRTITVLPAYAATWQTAIGQRNHLSTWDKRIMSFMYRPGNWMFVGDNNDGGDTGEFFDPRRTFSSGMLVTPPGGKLWLLSGRAYLETGLWASPVTIEAGWQTVTIGGYGN